MVGKNIEEMAPREFWSEVAGKPPKIRLEMMKRRCEGKDENACEAYRTAIEGDPETGRDGLRHLWEKEGNEVAKAILEQLGELRTEEEIKEEKRVEETVEKAVEKAAKE